MVTTIAVVNEADSLTLNNFQFIYVCPLNGFQIVSPHSKSVQTKVLSAFNFNFVGDGFRDFLRKSWRDETRLTMPSIGVFQESVDRYVSPKYSHFVAMISNHIGQQQRVLFVYNRYVDWSFFKFNVLCHLSHHDWTIANTVFEAIWFDILLSSKKTMQSPGNDLRYTRISSAMSLKVREWKPAGHQNLLQWGRTVSRQIQRIHIRRKDKLFDN